jgi:hypothetical protein
VSWGAVCRPLHHRRDRRDGLPVEVRTRLDGGPTESSVRRRQSSLHSPTPTPVMARRGCLRNACSTRVFAPCFGAPQLVQRQPKLHPFASPGHCRRPWIRHRKPPSRLRGPMRNQSLGAAHMGHLASRVWGSACAAALRASDSMPGSMMLREGAVKRLASPCRSARGTRSKILEIQCGVSYTVRASTPACLRSRAAKCVLKTRWLVHRELHWWRGTATRSRAPPSLP